MYNHKGTNTRLMNVIWFIGDQQKQWRRCIDVCSQCNLQYKDKNDATLEWMTYHIKRAQIKFESYIQWQGNQYKTWGCDFIHDLRKQWIQYIDVCSQCNLQYKDRKKGGGKLMFLFTWTLFEQILTREKLLVH